MLRPHPRSLALGLVPLLAWPLARGPGQQPQARRADGEQTGELVFVVREHGAGPIPARLTFVSSTEGAGGAGARPQLSAHGDGAPLELAVRDDVVYTKSGAGRIRVPAGRYTVFASRGLEWSLDARALELAPGQAGELEFELVHELDTRGWAGGDFQLHTRTLSGHGDVDLEERVLACLGEGLDFAVASDPDHPTDCGPSLRALGLEGRLACFTGSEVSAPFGHVSVFPLDPARAPVEARVGDANELFRRLRVEPNPLGVVPLIQLNHPRLEGIGAFARLGLDPLTGTSADPAYGRDFDALEILSGNLALGYDEPPPSACNAPGPAHAALRDWFHLLDLGERPAALGNSGSHPLRASVAGYPRNYVRLERDEPAGIQAGALAEAVRAKRVFTTTGPFLEFSVAGTEMGGTARATEGHARLSVRVRAASWVDCDRVRVWVDGALAATLPVADSRTPLRLEQELELCLRGACELHGRTGATPAPHDAWVVLVVEGDDPLTPVLESAARSLAVSNPVWIDGDGDGLWTGPRARIAAELRAQATPAIARAWFARLAPGEQAHALALVPRGPFAAVLLEDGLVSAARDVRRAAARACERVSVGGALEGVRRAWDANTDDPFLGALLLRVLATARPGQVGASLAAYAERFSADCLRRHSSELAGLLAGADVGHWQGLGPLAPPDPGRARTPPDPGPLAGADGEPARAWQELVARADGYVDLEVLQGSPTDHALVYAQTFLHSPAARSVRCAFGCGDGGRVWLADRLVYENPAVKTADPLEALLTLELQPGWNRLALEVEDATGDSGFYFRLLEPGLESAAQPR